MGKFKLRIYFIEQFKDITITNSIIVAKEARNLGYSSINYDFNTINHKAAELINCHCSIVQAAIRLSKEVKKKNYL